MPTRLKSLELQGYKTFASRTLFEFGEQITAIVGPNGSGKSNIADSLRWVLGEQSYSLLRGKKTEDMIFAGSEHRPRAGMASATIIFDNADGWLPIDFSEVAITRRAYRDGQNEYLINGQRMRLKDVSELLAQSGLAERTYTIIGQGLVDAALALKAEERRRLFEEASGTGLHRARKEEALRRLDTTRRNLERVEDILAELQPRLRSLERQARRAQEYDQVKADLQVVLREWYGYHWHKSQKELAEAQSAVRRQDAKLQRSREVEDSLDLELSVLREKAQGLRASLNSWHRQSAQLHNRREAISRDLAVAEERLRALQEQEQASRSELVRAEEELNQQQERLNQAGQQVSMQEETLAEARQEVSEARRAVSERQAEREDKEKEYQAARQESAAAQSRQNQLQARFTERQNQVERNVLSLREITQNLQAAEADVKAGQEVRTANEEALADAQAKQQEAEQSFQSYQEQVVKVEAARKEVLSLQSSRTAERSRLQARYEVLKQAENAFTGYARGTRVLLQSEASSRQASARAALNSILEVPAELEIPIAAAMGEYLGAVLLSSDPSGALEILDRQSLRGILLPLKSLQPLPPLALSELSSSQDGIIGVAADLVRAPAEFRPAVDLLLGQVLIVQDRSTARRLAPDLPALARLVTLKGEVFFANGPVVSAGKAEQEGPQALLARQRQQRELQHDLDAIEGELSQVQKQLSDLDTTLRELQDCSAGLEADLRSARQAAQKAAVEANQSKLKLEQSQAQLKWQQGQRQRLEDQMQHDQEEMAHIQQELHRLGTDLEEARQRVREKAAEMAELNLEDVQSQVNHWNTQAAVAERSLAEAKSRLRERTLAVERARNNQVLLQKRIDDLEASQAELLEEKSGWRSLENELAGELESLRALIEPAEAELDQVEATYAEGQKREATARQALSQAEHNHAQARILLARRQEAMETLRHRIEDDFGLVAFEYVDQVSGPTPLPLEGMVEQLPFVSELSADTEETIRRQRAHLRRLGAINPEAQAEYQEVRERVKFLTEQVADLQKAENDVRQVIAELDELMEREFLKTFNAVAGEFKEIFTRLFGGGYARLILTDPENLTDTGIDIEARLPGRRTQGLSLLSGGERSLTAVALVFALLKISPTPFCVLDEVDAMLDEANVGRFRDLLRELSQNTQFVVVTHNRNTVQAADVIYGVTMGRDTSSQVLSLRLDQVADVVRA